jgi:four helix bundle protein
MNEAEMKARTKAFALRTVRLVESLPRTRAADVIGRQLLRSATSVGANCRAVCRARSGADFLNKLAVVEEEDDESCYWLEILIDAGVMPRARLAALLAESNEITAILVASIRSAKRVQKRLSARTADPKSRIQNPK